MQTLWSLLDFLGKAAIVVASFGACLALLLARTRRRQPGPAPIELTEIGLQRKRRADALRRDLMPRGARKVAEKAARASAKREEEQAGLDRRVFVLDFEGDLQATAVESLREEVTAILGVAQAGDEVLVRLESAGGTVHGYGLAASQLARLRARAIPLTVCVDRVAASGGYMMAAVAQRIVSAPFAILGSIGVVATVPNAHRALERLGVDVTDITAGEHKRTLTLFGPLREEGLAKLKEQLEDTHVLFKDFLRSMRPSLDIDAVGTGEHWYGTRALELGLVDGLATSDDVLGEKAEIARVYQVRCARKPSLRRRLSASVSALLREALA
jgi:serine protease SohB